MSVKELQKRIEELEQELEPLRKYKDCYIVQYYNKEHLEELVDFKLTEEQFEDLTYYLDDRAGLEYIIHESIMELIPDALANLDIYDPNLVVCPYCKTTDIEEDDLYECETCDKKVCCMECSGEEDLCSKHECNKCNAYYCKECLKNHKCECENGDDIIYQVRTYILAENGEDEEVDDIVDFETKEEAKKYYDEIQNTRKALTFNSKDGDEEYEVIEESIVHIEDSDSDSDSDGEEIIITYNYEKMKVPELKALCKSKGIKGYSKLKKQELISLLII